MEDEKHKSATQTNLLELRGEIIRNMQDNDDYYKMRITSLLKDIEIEKKKSTEVNFRINIDCVKVGFVYLVEFFFIVC